MFNPVPFFSLFYSWVVVAVVVHVDESVFHVQQGARHISGGCLHQL